MPQVWRKAIIILLYKEGSRNDYKSNRGISIVFVPGKQCVAKGGRGRVHIWGPPNGSFVAVFICRSEWGAPQGAKASFPPDLKLCPCRKGVWQSFKQDEKNNQ